METQFQTELNCVVELFNEGWNLLLTLEGMPLTSANAVRRQQNQIERFKVRAGKSLKKIGMEILDFSGEIYTPELPVSVINLGDFKSSDELRILKMKKLTIKRVGSAEVIQNGVAIVEKYLK